MGKTVSSEYKIIVRWGIKNVKRVFMKNRKHGLSGTLCAALMFIAAVMTRKG
jgi:hypothetical protein